MQELDPAATGIFGMKVIGKYDGNYVVAALAWVKTGTGVDTVYTFTFSFINTDLDALFHVDADVTNDVVTVSLMGEVQWILGGARHKSQTITVKIVNDVNRAASRSCSMKPRGRSAMPQLSDEEIARFAANRYRFRGVEINARLFRQYPKGEMFSHVVGHIGRINQRELDQLEEEGKETNYKGTDYIGKVGLEDKYEEYLRNHRRGG